MEMAVSKKKSEALEWPERLANVLPLRRGQKFSYDKLWKLPPIERTRIRQAAYSLVTGGKWDSYHQSWTDEKIREWFGNAEIQRPE
jgi:hypothetical protein